MRFPEFSGEWENKILKSVLKCHDNFRIPLSDKRRKNMKGQYAYYGANGIIDFIDKFIFNGNYILLAEDGGKFDEFRTKPIAHKASGKFWVNNHAHVLSTNNILDFVFYQLEHKDIRSFINIGSRSKLNKNDMFNIIISLCSLKEQSKIANFLSLIDKRIELQNKIIKDYELLKKEINIKMFTHSPKLPTLRFKEFKNDLAIKKIKNIVEYSKSGGGTPNTSIKEYYNGTIPFLSISDITVQSKYIYSTNKHITELGLKNSSTWIVPINTVTLTMYASFGIPCIIKNNMCTSQAMYNMIINKNNNYEYVYYYLNFLKNIRYYNSLAEQGSQFNLNSSIIKNINLFLPSLKEQLKIANFLSKLDEILLNVKCEKERLIKNKTFLLQNLFI